MPMIYETRMESEERRLEIDIPTLIAIATLAWVLVVVAEKHPPGTAAAQPGDGAGLFRVCNPDGAVRAGRGEPGNTDHLGMAGVLHLRCLGAGAEHRVGQRDESKLVIVEQVKGHPNRNVVEKKQMSCKCRPYDVVIPSPIPIMWIKFKKRRTS